MPVIPTFNPRVDLAGAYLGGQKIKVAREQLAQEAASDAARIALGREQLQQEAIANEMQLAAKQDLLSREALQKAQEAEIEKSYKETQFGLANRKLQQDEQTLQMKVQEAARDFEAEQTWNREFPILVQDAIKAGRTPQEAQSDAARSLMLRRGGVGASTALNPPRAQSELPGVNFQFKQLQAAKDDLLRKYPGSMALAIPPAVQAELDKISKQQQALSPQGGLTPPPTRSGTNSALKILSIRRK